MKTPFQRILSYNLAILLLATVVLRLVNRGQEADFSFLFEMAALIGSMLFVNIGLGFTSATKEERQAHWLSFLLVLLIGFGACAAGASIQL